MLKRFRQPTLLCFSPPVMIATIAIELSLAVWVVARYATSTSKRLIVTLLVCLAAFQLAEFNVCSSAPVDLFWSRFGYVFITALPPLGLHLTYKLRRESRRKVIAVSYGVAAVFATAFAVLPTSLNHGVCAGNYVIFLLSEPLATAYEACYFGMILFALALTLIPVSGKSTLPRRHSLYWLAVAYLAFSVPTIVINFIIPATKAAIPSIMCGFAVIFALTLGLKIAPLALTISPYLSLEPKLPARARR